MAIRNCIGLQPARRELQQLQTGRQLSDIHYRYHNYHRHQHYPQSCLLIGEYSNPLLKRQTRCDDA